IPLASANFVSVMFNLVHDVSYFGLFIPKRNILRKLVMPNRLFIVNSDMAYCCYENEMERPG
ncbi:hypothetical protein, partial [Vibrio anguillarum]|uniref:hypothetical protein n=1 Tax=Vibrio anguillarum TaxID=55601 RepID=UPI001BE4D329